MNNTEWQRCRTPWWPRRTIDGQWIKANGHVWRRQVNGKWIYRQDEETLDELDARVW